ncbi:MAG: phosphatase PAP2 family protein [Bacteroidetes bacterium]|nr:phosphatase PAP2 family protein [Bacteroidota bacterium]
MNTGLRNSFSNPFIFLFIVFQVVGWASYFLIGKDNFFFLFNGSGGKLADIFFYFFTLFGEWPFISFCILFVLIYYRQEVIKVGLVFIANAVLSFVLKNYVFSHSPRPAKYFTDNIISVHFSPYLSLNFWQSFPSGHTFTVFTGMFFLALLVNKPKIYTLCFILALTTGISRIYNGMHFPEDVLAGSFLGVINALVIYIFVPPIKAWSENK